jgi:hypothetical protein
LARTGTRYPIRMPKTKAATLYRRMQAGNTRGKDTRAIGSKIHDLLDYETLRRKSGSRNG